MSCQYGSAQIYYRIFIIFFVRLISSGARVPADGPLNVEVITAAISGDLERVKGAMEKGVSFSAKTRGSGASARLLASALGHMAIPKDGMTYVRYPPTRTPKDSHYYLFQGKIYSEANDIATVEVSSRNPDLGRYWDFRIPRNSSFTPRVGTAIMVIGKIVGSQSTSTVRGKPLHIAIVSPVAIANGDGDLLWIDAQ
jgi:hypothetical protein